MTALKHTRIFKFVVKLNTACVFIFGNRIFSCLSQSMVSLADSQGKLSSNAGQTVCISLLCQWSVVCWVCNSSLTSENSCFFCLLDYINLFQPHFNMTSWSVLFWEVIKACQSILHWSWCFSTSRLYLEEGGSVSVYHYHLYDMLFKRAFEDHSEKYIDKVTYSFILSQQISFALLVC